MNERIQELLKESFVKGHWSTNGERFIQGHTDMEKFAELIVRECADLVTDDDNAFDILKHFGVE